MMGMNRREFLRKRSKWSGTWNRTAVGDATELKALDELYRNWLSPGGVALGSVKSQIGHTKAAPDSRTDQGRSPSTTRFNRRA